MVLDMDMRRQKIVELVDLEGTVSFAQIKKAFPNVSEMTLRTDLKNLDEARRIVRVHGGARSVSYVIGTDDLIDNRSIRKVSEKMEIARKAVDLIHSNTTIFIDSGSTATILARSIPDMPLLVFTSSLTAASELAHLDQVQTYLIGGRLNPFSLSVNGSNSIDAVKGLSYDQIFLGVTCYQDGFGLSCSSAEESALKKVLIASSDKVIALMDSSKVGRRATFSFCDLDQVDILVTDGKAPDSLLTACEHADVKVL